MIELIGHKTTAIFDIWSVVHFLTGCGLAYPMATLSQRFKLGEREKIALVLLISAIWELVEIYLELGTIGGEAVQFWFQGVEHPLNRIFGDQILLLLGYLLTRNSMRASLLAKTASGAWLLWHVFFLPHSMWVQDTLIQ